MVGEQILIRGGIYLAKFDQAKRNEVGKVRPIVILNSQLVLDSEPLIIFICPLSSKSHTGFSNLHVELQARDAMQVNSYALVEHCRSITTSRVIYTRISQSTDYELRTILHRLSVLVGL